MATREHRGTLIMTIFGVHLGMLLLLMPQPAHASEQYDTDVHNPIKIEYSTMAGFGNVPDPVFTSSNEAVARVEPAGSSFMSMGSSYWIAASCKVTPVGPGTTTISYYLNAELKATTTVTVTGSHTATHSTASQATCEQPAMTEGTHCSVCGLTLSGRVETSPALGHAWNEWVITKKATATKAGTRERTCSTCGEKETESFGGIITGDTEAAQALIDAQDGSAVARITSNTSKTVRLKRGAKKTASSYTISLNAEPSKSGNILVYAKKNGNSKIKVSSTGKITLKKGAAKGVYTAQIKASCGKMSRTVTVKYLVR